SSRGPAASSFPGGRSTTSPRRPAAPSPPTRRASPTATTTPTARGTRSPATTSASRRGRTSMASSSEVHTIAAARRLAETTSVFIGVGRPSTAALLARMVHNPDLVLVYESGTIGAKPHRIPLSIGDGELAETADATVSVPEMFNYWIQPGRIQVAFLGAAQVDRHANLNSTVLGDYAHPTTRLPGGGVAPE